MKSGINKGRYRSLELMRALQPCIQLGLISASSAKEIVDEFVSGNKKKLEGVVNDPNLPMQYIGVTQNLKNFL